MAIRTNDYREAQNQRAEELLSRDENVIYEEKKEETEIKDGTEPSQDLVNETKKYRYPLTMSKNYPAHITFTAYKVEGVDIGELLGEAGTKALEAIAGRYSRNASNTSAPDSEDASESDQELTEEQKAAAKEATNKAIAISYENLSGGTDVGSVMLPLQQSLTFQDGVVYNVANLGIAGSALGSALGGKNPFEGLLSEGGKVTRAASGIAAEIIAKNAASVLGGAIGSAAGAAGGIVGFAGLGGVGEGVGAAVKNATRVSTNPNQRTLFENVNMREFSFIFKMVANNAKEAQEIKNIVKFFREELYPEPILTSAGIPLAYEFPNVFEISIKNFAGEDPAPKIQRCYLSNVQTVYNATANSMHTDGNFVEVDVSLSFKEITALNKAKVRDGGY